MEIIGIGAPGEVVAESERQLLMAHFRNLVVERTYQSSGEDWLLACQYPDLGFASLHLSLFSDDPEASLADADSLLRRTWALEQPDVAFLRCVGHQARIRKRCWPALGGLVLRTTTTEVGDFLPLPDNFEHFVESLGKKTRRNIRSSLREFADSGLRFRVNHGAFMPLGEEMVSLAERCLPVPVPLGKLAQITTFVDRRSQPFYSEIVDEGGRPWSVIQGYRADVFCVVVNQLNPNDFPKMGQGGASLLHRALLIRHLIGEGTAGVIFVDGCSGALRDACHLQVAQTFLCISYKPSAWIRVVRHAFTRLALRRLMLQKLCLLVRGFRTAS